MKFEILSRIKSVFKDMSAFKNFRNLKRVIYQSEIGYHFGFLSHKHVGLLTSIRWKVYGPKSYYWKLEKCPKATPNFLMSYAMMISESNFIFLESLSFWLIKGQNVTSRLSNPRHDQLLSRCPNFRWATKRTKCN